MAEEKSLLTRRDSFKNKNPFNRLKDEDNSRNKTGLTMRKSWSTSSLTMLNNNNNRLGKSVCACPPNKHEGSFRCWLHRSSATTSHGAATTTQHRHHLPKPKSRGAVLMHKYGILVLISCVCLVLLLLLYTKKA